MSSPLHSPTTTTAADALPTTQFVWNSIQLPPPNNVDLEMAQLEPSEPDIFTNMGSWADVAKEIKVEKLKEKAQKTREWVQEHWPVITVENWPKIKEEFWKLYEEPQNKWKCLRDQTLFITAPSSASSSGSSAGPTAHPNHNTYNKTLEELLGDDKI